MDDKSILWWGRFDPDYSRNRIVRQSLQALGWTLTDFHPHFAPLGDLEARLRLQGAPRLVWVPCFRQRDVMAASRWAQRRRIPLLFDPLISAYDKQVFERGKLAPDSAAARRLLAWERRRFERADILLADTPLHADFFRDTFGIPAARIHILPVGAEEHLFRPQPPGVSDRDWVDVLFFGSFIPLQGPQVIVEAARLAGNTHRIRWHLVGAGPLRRDCESLARGLDNVLFEDWIPYAQLSQRIQQADLLLGIFGTTPKAGRVIPNKVYQALACAKPVITQRSDAYPAAMLTDDQSGIVWVEPGHPEQLADAVMRLAQNREALTNLGAYAGATYRRHFSAKQLTARLGDILDSVVQRP